MLRVEDRDLSVVTINGYTTAEESKKKEGSKRSIHRKFDVDRCYGSFVE